MELLANHLAIAIENARLYGEVRDRLAEVTGLQAASSALAEELLPERALRVIAQQALSLSSATTVSIELLRAGGEPGSRSPSMACARLAAMRVAVEDPWLARRSRRVGRRFCGRCLVMSPCEPKVAPRPSAPKRVAWRSRCAPQPHPARCPRTARNASTPARWFAGHLRQPGGDQPRQRPPVRRAAESTGRDGRSATPRDAAARGARLRPGPPLDLSAAAAADRRRRSRPRPGGRPAVSGDAHRCRTVRRRPARHPTPPKSFAAEALRSNRSQRSDDAQNDPRATTEPALGNTRTILSVPMKTSCARLGC